MDESNLKRCITIGIIVLVNIIIVIFTCISVIKSINKIESGNVPISTKSEEDADSYTENMNEVQEDDLQEDDTSMSFSSLFSKIAKSFKQLNTQNILLCILLLIGTNLVVLSCFIFKKLK